MQPSPAASSAAAEGSGTADCTITWTCVPSGAVKLATSCGSPVSVAEVSGGGIKMGRTQLFAGSQRSTRIVSLDTGTAPGLGSCVSMLMRSLSAESGSVSRWIDSLLTNRKTAVGAPRSVISELGLTDVSSASASVLTAGFPRLSLTGWPESSTIIRRSEMPGGRGEATAETGAIPAKSPSRHVRPWIVPRMSSPRPATMYEESGRESPKVSRGDPQPEPPLRRYDGGHAHASLHEVS